MASKVTYASMSGGLSGLVWVGWLIAFSWGLTVTLTGRGERMRAGGPVERVVFDGHRSPPE